MNQKGLNGGKTPQKIIPYLLLIGQKRRMWSGGTCAKTNKGNFREILCLKMTVQQKPCFQFTTIMHFFFKYAAHLLIMLIMWGNTICFSWTVSWLFTLLKCIVMPKIHWSMHLNKEFFREIPYLGIILITHVFRIPDFDLKPAQILENVPSPVLAKLPTGIGQTANQRENGFHLVFSSRFFSR